MLPILKPAGVQVSQNKPTRPEIDTKVGEIEIHQASHRMAFA